MRTLLDKLFRDRENVYAKRRARWIVVVIALALGGFLVLAPAGQDEQLNHVASVILVAFGGLALLYALICEILAVREGHLSPEQWDRKEEDRRVREGVEQAAKMQAIYGALNAGGSPERS
jgi:hypothetical protein